MQVHTVAFDVANEPEAVEQLKAVAAAGCGQFFAADSAIELRQALHSAGQMTFTVTDPATGESWTGSVGSESLLLPSGTYRLTIEAHPPVDLGVIEINSGSKTTVPLARKPEGFRRSGSH
jgi:hypothetical protein